jgi:hypothetical protein
MKALMRTKDDKKQTWNLPHVPSEEQMVEWETENGIVLPADFRDYLLKYNDMVFLQQAVYITSENKFGHIHMIIGTCRIPEHVNFLDCQGDFQIWGKRINANDTDTEPIIEGGVYDGADNTTNEHPEAGAWIIEWDDASESTDQEMVFVRGTHIGEVWYYKNDVYGPALWRVATSFRSWIYSSIEARLFIDATESLRTSRIHFVSNTWQHNHNMWREMFYFINRLFPYIGLTPGAQLAFWECTFPASFVKLHNLLWGTARHSY